MYGLYLKGKEFVLYRDNLCGLFINVEGNLFI